MLYLRIKKFKEVMKTEKFHKDIGGTEAFMKINIKATNRCETILSNDILFSYIWIRLVKIVEEANSDLLGRCDPVQLDLLGKHL